MDLSQHAAYLKGLAEGKGLTEDAEKGDFVKALLAASMIWQKRSNPLKNMCMS